MKTIIRTIIIIFVLVVMVKTIINTPKDKSYMEYFGKNTHDVLVEFKNGFNSK